MLNERFGDYSIKVSSDNKSYKLIRHSIVKSGKTKGDEYLEVLGHFNSISSCVKSMARLEGNKKDTLKEFIKEYQRVCDHFEDIFKSI